MGEMREGEREAKRAGITMRPPPGTTNMRNARSIDDDDDDMIGGQ
jgi:hypothetical protein